MVKEEDDVKPWIPDYQIEGTEAFNRAATRSALAYQKRVKAEMLAKYGKDFKFKVVKFDT